MNIKLANNNLNWKTNISVFHHTRYDLFPNIDIEPEIYILQQEDYQLILQMRSWRPLVNRQHLYTKPAVLIIK